MTSREQYIAGVKKGKLHQGKNELLTFLQGERLTQKEAILAHCYDCQGFYNDGAEDCLSDICPLRPFMPYNPNKQPSVARTGKPTTEDLDEDEREESA